MFHSTSPVFPLCFYVSLNLRGPLTHMKDLSYSIHKTLFCVHHSCFIMHLGDASKCIFKLPYKKIFITFII